MAIWRSLDYAGLDETLFHARTRSVGPSAIVKSPAPVQNIDQNAEIDRRRGLLKRGLALLAAW